MRKCVVCGMHKVNSRTLRRSTKLRWAEKDNIGCKYSCRKQRQLSITDARDRDSNWSTSSIDKLNASIKMDLNGVDQLNSTDLFTGIHALEKSGQVDHTPNPASK